MSEDNIYFISFPRSGCIWLQAVLELYFDRPRGPKQNGGITWRPFRKGDEYLWIHSHDKGLKLKPKKPSGHIFLYRNPVDAIYSLLSFRIKGSLEEKILNESRYFKNLFKKWVLEGRASTILTYEEAVEDTNIIIKKASQHFQIPWNQSQAQYAIGICTKEAILTKMPRSRFHSRKSLSKKYINGREEFRESWEKFIFDIILNEENRPYLSDFVSNELATS